MKSLSQYKGIIVTVILLTLVIAVYNFFFKEDISSVTVDPTQSINIGNDLLLTYEELKAVRLDTSLFSAQGYLYLVDFSADIANQPVGRPNPFDFIGRN